MATCSSCMGECANGFFGSIGVNPRSESNRESLRLAIFYGLGGFDTWRKEMVRKVEKVARANARYKLVQGPADSGCLPGQQDFFGGKANGPTFGTTKDMTGVAAFTMTSWI